jgi:hypothetical protein
MSTLGWLLGLARAGVGLVASKLGIKGGPPSPEIPVPHEPVQGTTVCVWCGVRMTLSPSGRPDYFTKPWCTRGDKTVELP